MTSYRCTWTYDVVVVAADRGGVALALANTDDVDGRAIETNLSVGIDDNVQEIEDSSDDSSAVSLWKSLEEVRT